MCQTNTNNKKLSAGRGDIHERANVETIFGAADDDDDLLKPIATTIPVIITGESDTKQPKPCSN